MSALAGTPLTIILQYPPLPTTRSASSSRTHASMIFNERLIPFSDSSPTERCLSRVKAGSHGSAWAAAPGAACRQTSMGFSIPIQRVSASSTEACHRSRWPASHARIAWRTGPCVLARGCEMGYDRSDVSARPSNALESERARRTPSRTECEADSPATVERHRKGARR